MEIEDAPTEVASLRAELAKKIDAHAPLEGPQATAISGLGLSRRSAPSECYSAAYEPELVVFAQGEKRISVGGATHVCDGANFLLTSVDLPVVAQITKASEHEPFLGLSLKLQMPMVREILSQEEFLAAPVTFGARGMAVGQTPREMLSACCRLLICWTHQATFPSWAALCSGRSSIGCCAGRLASTCAPSPLWANKAIAQREL